ncbi:hypothetical protein BN3662_00459 [Clostridiales bacterium CHKCI006]|nr:hypothetical protein BN3662_00459 [Clostridiales bacterium CHKCI006]
MISDVSAYLTSPMIDTREHSNTFNRIRFDHAQKDRKDDEYEMDL